MIFDNIIDIFSSLIISQIAQITLRWSTDNIYDFDEEVSLW